MADKRDNTGPERKPPAKKSDKATVALRVEEVLRIRLDGAQWHDIVQYGAEKGWGVSERMIGKYIAKADALLVERLDKKRSRVIARHIAKREALFARAVNAGDLRTALATLDSEAKLRGLFPDANAKDLAKFAAALGLKAEEIEKRVRDAARPDSPATEDGRPTAGPSGGSTAEGIGPTGTVESGPGPADG